MNKRRMTIIVDEDTYQEVRYRSYVQNISMSEIICRAVKLLGKLERRQKGEQQ